MSIEGRFGHERARLSGEFTDADRAWRKQWLKDQHLAPDEPRVVPELQREFKNAFRRIYRAPMDALFRALEPTIGTNVAQGARWLVPKFTFMYLGLLGFHYMQKYNQGDWTRVGGLRVLQSRSDCLPCHEGFPRLSDRTRPSDYNDCGFSKRKVFRDM